MKIRDWFKVASIAVFLVVVPSSLAMVTAYQTPAIGLGWRALTVLVY
jgi:hypothetical protein